MSSSALVHYNPSLPLKLAADTSAYGVGAVVSHVMPNGEEHFASRTLQPSECNYVQLERGLGPNVRDKEVPSMPFWKEIYIEH